MKQTTKRSFVIAVLVAIGVMLTASTAVAQAKPAAACPERAGAVPCEKIGPRPVPKPGETRPRILPALAGEQNGQEVWRYGRWLMT